MFERFQSFFQTLTSRSSPDFAPDDPRLAVAALCFQVMEADGTVSDAEKKQLRLLLSDYYRLEDDRLDALMAAGQEAGHAAVDYYRFTTDLKRQLDEAERIELIGILWDIVYADGVRSEMEDHVIWRIADLLGVTGRDRVTARQLAADRADKGDFGDSDGA